MPKYAVVLLKKVTTYQRCAGQIEAAHQARAEDMALDMAQHGRFEWTTTSRREEDVYIESSEELIDTSDIPEAGEEWFKKAKFYPNGR